MQLVYDLLIQISWLVMKVVSPLSQKIKRGVVGRRHSSYQSLSKINPNQPLIWMHAASLGEFEQGTPLIQKIKEEHPHYQVLVTFFSPSGYEVKKDTKIAEATCYLPWDTQSQLFHFLNQIKPRLVLFIKYEVWPNLYQELYHRSIPIYLVSAHFNPNQIYFKWYGRLLRETLTKVNHFFVQEATDVTLLQSIKIHNVTLSGDTRYDRVSELFKKDEKIELLEKFKDHHKILIIGSSWEEDEAVILPFINANNHQDLKIIIAPHHVDDKNIERLENQLKVPFIKYTEWRLKPVSNPKVLLLNTIGLLSRSYKYADFAYVGGAFRTGLHNTLEAAVFGIPVIIGPNFQKFPEAVLLTQKGGMVSISNAKEFAVVLNTWIQNQQKANQLGYKNQEILLSKKGATQAIYNHLAKNNLN